MTRASARVVQFAAMMAARREQLGLTKTQVAQLTGVDDGRTVGAWERGAKIPTLESTLRWLHALGIELKERD